MFFYVLLFLLLIFSIIRHPDNKKIGVFWICILCFLSMFRAESVGTDTANYTNFSNEISELIIDKNTDFEIGRMLEISYLSLKNWLYGNDYSPRLLICVMSIVTFLFLFLTLKRMRLSYGIGVLVFTILFYLASFNIARQICACSIILYSYTFLFEKDNKRYFFFLYIFLATSFHASSILYLTLYIFRYIKTGKFKTTTLAYFAICLFLINMIYPLPISEWLISSFSSISYVRIYSERSVTSSLSIIGILYSFIQIFPCILVFIKCNKEKLNTQDFIFYLSIISLILFSTANSDFARIFLPLQIFQVLYITNLYVEKRLKKSPFYLFVALKTLLVLYGASTGSGEVVPYIIDFNFSVYN